MEHKYKIGEDVYYFHISYTLTKIMDIKKAKIVGIKNSERGNSYILSTYLPTLKINSYDLTYFEEFIGRTPQEAVANATSLILELFADWVDKNMDTVNHIESRK